MKEDQDCCNKEVVFKKFGVAHDKFILNVANSKVKIKSVNMKPLISSYFIGDDYCGRCLNIYGIIFVEIIYKIDNDCNKCSQVFATTFSQMIYIPDDKCKVCSVTVDIVDKCIKKLSECNIVGFFTLLFMVKISIPKCEKECTSNTTLEDCDCTNSIEIQCDLEDSCKCNRHDKCRKNEKRHPRKSHSKRDEYYQCDDFICEDDNEPSITFKNDIYTYISGFQRNNRV